MAVSQASIYMTSSLRFPSRLLIPSSLGVDHHLTHPAARSSQGTDPLSHHIAHSTIHRLGIPTLQMSISRVNLSGKYYRDARQAEEEVDTRESNDGKYNGKENGRHLRCS